MADFFGCMQAAQRGWSIEETANKLMERLHDESDALLTAQNAAAAARTGRVGDRL